MFRRHLQALAQPDHRVDAALFVHHVGRQLVGRRQRLAKVVAERRVTDQLIARCEPCGHVADQLDVDAGIDLGMVFRALRHAVQRVDLGQHRAQCIGVAQGAQERGGRGTAQGLGEFLPDALWHQFGQFAGCRDLPHQCQRVRRDAEPARREAGHETRRAQHPQRILDEGVADMPQHARLDVGGAAERIHQAAVFGTRDRIDGEVAAAQVFLQRHRGLGMHHEAGMSARRFALGTRQRMFLAGAWMQEHREVATDLLEAGIQHLLRAGADHHVIMVARGQAEQGIAHRAADQVDLHAVGERRLRRHQAMMPESIAWTR